MKEGMMEWSKVIGAILIGTVHELREVRAEKTDRGGCVEGVSINFVRAMSSGERIRLAIPAAETATARERRGVSDERISIPVADPKSNDEGGEDSAESCELRPGSGRDNTAARKDLEKEVKVDSRME